MLTPPKMIPRDRHSDFRLPINGNAELIAMGRLDWTTADLAPGPLWTLRRELAEVRR